MLFIATLDTAFIDNEKGFSSKKSILTTKKKNVKSRVDKTEILCEKSIMIHRHFINY